MSDKQIARTVIDKAPVEMIFPGTSTAITGWVGGVDDFHWLVFTASGVPVLVHKTSVYVRILKQDSLDLPEGVEKATAAFRKFCDTEYGNGRTEDASELR